jgi:alpha-tubulin suppressor-like RCC1 family protein
MNKWGNLGDGTTTDRYIPTPIGEDNFDIVDISTGRLHTLIMKKGGRVLATGDGGVR